MSQTFEINRELALSKLQFEMSATPPIAVSFYSTSMVTFVLILTQIAHMPNNISQLYSDDSRLYELYVCCLTSLHI